MSLSQPIGSDIILNLLPVSFDCNEVRGELLPYSTEADLRALQDRTVGKWICRRAGKNLQAIPIHENETLSGEPATFVTEKDWSLFGKLLEEGVRRLLKSIYPAGTISNFGEVWLKATGGGTDIASDAMKAFPSLRNKPQLLHIYRLYHFEAAYLRTRSDEAPNFGLRVKLSTNWQIGMSIAELTRLGVDLTGCYVLPLRPGSTPAIGNKIVGSVREIRDGKVFLIDARDSDVVDAADYTIEASQENVVRSLAKAFGPQSTSVLREVRRLVAEFLGSVGQQTRIMKIAETLARQPIACARNLSAVCTVQLQRATPNGSPLALAFEEPKFVVKFGKAPITGPIAAALDAGHGPFDRDSFKKTTPYILVLTPKQWLGQVEQFLGKWRDGGLGSPYTRGFLGKFYLRGCEFKFLDFDPKSATSADYEQACLQALRDSKEQIRRFDLAIIVTSEKHKLLGANDPYLVSKAILLSQGVATQALEIETINSQSSSWPFILNNLALASYAKLGGTPWTLAAPKGEGITHEVIVGLGNAIVKRSRLGDQERYVGIATLFNYDGVYLVSRSSQESTIKEYPGVLESVLLSTIESVGGRKGWRRGDRVRLIFHTYKPLKNAEIEAVKALVNNRLKDFSVDFAFLVIGDDHNWTMYDPESKGILSKGSYRGVQVPKRGSAVILNEGEMLVGVTGPKELKFAAQGTPTPLRLHLNGASTFKDLRYLGEQVFNFSYMSWQTFNLAPLPVTIAYSGMIASFLGRLRQVRNWNANALETTDLGDSLWFL
ncbi:MAG: hypothetical protein M1132_01515 [Chloroflexi bacterium]|nr:hypothetical protein [Chloroflexota bacterium]